MGSNPSVQHATNQEVDTRSIISNNSADSISSGFHSSTSTPPCDHPAKHKPRMSRPQLGTRPSVIVRGLIFQEEEEEKSFENQHVKQTPALRAVLKGFEDCKRALTDKSKRTEDAFESLFKMLDDKVKQPFHKYGNDEQRMVMANNLARIEFVKSVTDYYDFVMDELDIVAVTGDFVEESKELNDPAFKLILTIREILWNFSDGSPRFSEELSTTNMIHRLVEDLEKINEDGLQQMEEEGEDFLFAFSSAVGILHNCARNPDVDKKVFRDAGAVEKLYPFLKSNLVYVKMITLLALGNMIKEDQMKDLKAGTDLFEFLMEAIIEAMQAKDRKRHGFHLSELVDGLASLAQSNENKKMIMLKNPLEVIQRILRSQNHLEVLAAIKLVWELAFLEENKQKILSIKQLKQILSDLKTSENDAIKNAASGACFVIFDMEERKEDERNRPVPVQPVPKGKHIMFSYCWGDKEMVYKIYKILNSEGYPIWLDVNEMEKYGNVLDGMAMAVEEAATILIFYSEKYKNSQNCRTEADYAYLLKKTIIPIKVQRGYTPDGWLGALIGARLFIEFSPKYDFDFKLDELRKQLPPKKSFDEVDSRPKPGPEPPVVKKKEVWEWQRTDIEKWAKEYKLSGKVNKLSGENLDFLHNVMLRAPETFYRWAEEKVQLKSLDDLMRFDAAVRSLKPSINTLNLGKL